MRKRARIAEYLDRLGVFDALFRAPVPRPWFTVLTFHRARPPSGGYLFDDGVLDAELSLFDRQVATLTKHCDLIGIDDLVRFHDGGKLPAKAVLVTFDDGYRDNHDAILPILRRHGGHAAFFVATDYLSERRVFWWDRIAYTVKRADRGVVRLRELEVDLAQKDQAIGALLRVVKDTSGLDLRRFLDELSDAAGVPWDRALEQRLADELLMTWDHVRALHDAGMDVESHTRTHRVLQTLSAAELATELAGSRAEIETRLGKQVRALSYPCGKAVGDDPAIPRAVRSAGYAVAFTNTGGMNPILPLAGRRGDPLHIRRVSHDPDSGLSLFRGVLALPPLADRQA